MSVTSDILESVNSFVKAATNFAEIIEKNIDSYYRIKDKLSARHQLQSIESVLSIFPQIWFFNGMFAAHLRDVKSADHFADRDNPIIDEFEKALDDIEKVFDNEAPRIRGLGSEMVMIFKRQIALRRRLLIEVRNGTAMTRSSIGKMQEQLEPLHSVERHFSKLTWKYTHHAIREAALDNPALSESELAEKFGVSNLLVRHLLSDQPNQQPES